MIKRVSLVRLRPGLSRAECLRRWDGEHADLVRALPGVLEYTVDLAAGERPAGAWDALATVRFVDETALDRFRGDPDLQQRLLATRAEFAAAADPFIVDEHALIPRVDAL